MRLSRGSRLSKGFSPKRMRRFVDRFGRHESEEDKEYRPDFYLPDHDIYIEHWGLNENLEVPPWFTKTSQEYLELREWKLSQFEKLRKILIETWDFERKNEQLIPNLKKNLKEKIPDIQFVPLSSQELV